MSSIKFGSDPLETSSILQGWNLIKIDTQTSFKQLRNKINNFMIYIHITISTPSTTYYFTAFA